MDVNTIIEFYTSEFTNAIEAEFTVSEAKDIAKDAMNAKFPETKEWGFTAQKEWGLIGNAVQKVLKRYDKQPKKVELLEAKPIQTVRRINFMQQIRDTCEAGFLPRGQFLEPYIGYKKSSQVTAYKQQMVYAGYKFQETEFGWIVIEKPDPEIAEWKKQIALLQEKIAQKSTK